MTLKAYLSKIEDKYLFRISRLFWHVLVGLVTLSLIVGAGLVAWSLIPVATKHVARPEVPAKPTYPPPIGISLADVSPAAKIVAGAEVPATVVESQKQELRVDPDEPLYLAAKQVLEKVVPLEKITWPGEGQWTYPEGERYWQFYKQEKYRKWVATTPGADDWLRNAFERVGATSFKDRAALLNSYSDLMRVIPLANREDALAVVARETKGSVSSSESILHAVKPVIEIVSTEGGLGYLEPILEFSFNNTTEAEGLLGYMAPFIKKIDAAERVSVMAVMIQTFERSFAHSLQQHQDATQMFESLLPSVPKGKQAEYLARCYVRYVEKTESRARAIRELDDKYEGSVQAIEAAYQAKLGIAAMDEIAAKTKKNIARATASASIGGGIVALLLIAMILVFMSIQRSVRVIEFKLSNPPDREQGG